MEFLFKNRQQAGQQLASKLSFLSEEEKARSILLALPRGGVPVACEVAKTLNIPMDVLIVRKIGHPLQPEYGIGALAEGGFYWVDPDAIGVSEMTTTEINQLIADEKAEIDRRIEVYRKGRSFPSLHGKTAIIVDDGLATGVTAKVACEYAKSRGAQRVLLAVPVCYERTACQLREEVDEVICLNELETFSAVGHFYEDFEQLTDQEVEEMLLEPPPQSIEDTLVEHSVPLGSRYDIKPMIQKLIHSRIVMLGESSHGTQEFYEWRRLISQELIEHHGFNFIAVEGDWPPCAELNRYIHSINQRENAREVLGHFQRWPTWMWANTEISKLTAWLKLYNRMKPKKEKASFFGLDVYSLFESIDEILKQTKKIDPKLARRMQSHYECFDPFQRNEKMFAKSLHSVPQGCEDAALKALNELLQTRLETVTLNETLFDAQQNARIVKNAENYYRAMIHGTEDSWNIRDQHMMDTLEILLNHYGPNSKGIVWAHNTHIGDYRATDMKDAGQVNIGGLAREKWGEHQVTLVGFGTYQGEVIASHSWDGPMETMNVPPGQRGTYEELFHRASERLKQNALFIWLKGDLRDTELKQVHGHRAIGVVYHPAYERFGNYVPSSLSYRYDGFIFVDETHALTPLQQRFLREETPETWPQGF